MTDEPSALGDPNQPLRHRAFFEAAGELGEDSPEFTAMTAGLLVLRLLDKWPEPPRPMTPEIERARDADFGPVEEHVAAIDDGPVRRVLSAVVDGAREFSDGEHDGRLSPLIAYAQFLEDSNAWEPAADAFATAIEIIGATGRDADLLPLCYGHAADCLHHVGQLQRAHALLSSGIEIATRQTGEETTRQREQWLYRLGVAMGMVSAELLEQSEEWESAAGIYLGVIELIKPRPSDKSRLLPCYERAAYCLRQIGQMTEAADAYHDGITLAGQLGDVHTALHLRIAHAVLETQRGDLPEAEYELDQLIEDATRANQPDMVALATHERGMVAYARDEDLLAAQLFYTAASMHVDPNLMERAELDLAVALSDLGHAEYARTICELIRNAPKQSDQRTAAGINLLRLAPLRGDRTTFDQLRQELAAERMKGRLLAHYHLTLGQGWLRFGEKGAARVELQRTIEVAEAHKVNQLVMLAEKLLRATDELPRHVQKVPQDDPTLAPIFRAIDERQGPFAGAARR